VALNTITPNPVNSAEKKPFIDNNLLKYLLIRRSYGSFPKLN
jgi:hypothetical protein